MSICKRADGRWCVKTKDELRPGKYIQRTFRTQKEAKEYERAARHGAPKDERLTVLETVKLYVESKPLCDIGKNQYIWLVTGAGKGQKRAKQKVGYAECIAHRYVDTLTRKDLELVRDCARRGGASNSAINLWTRKLNAAFNYAVQEDLLEANPWARYRQLPAKHAQRNASIEDFRRIYAVLPEWMQWACRTAMSLCLRPGMVELFGLRWSAFDFQHGSVSVLMGKVGRMKTVFPPEDYMAEAAARFEAAGSDRNALVCPDAHGKSATQYRYALAAARRKAGVKEFPLYALRHIVASEQLAAGADVAAVAANLGHSSPQITLSYYAHTSPKAQKEASAKIGAAWCSHEEKVG